MRNQRLIILAALTFVAVLSVGRGIMNLSRGKKIQNSPPQNLNPPVPVSGIKIPEGKNGSKRTAFQIWGRNPFTFEEQGSQEKAPGIFLNGIVWDRKKPQAVINGSIVEPGDEIAGFTVVDIKQNAVVLNNGAGNLDVKLGHKK